MGELTLWVFCGMVVVLSAAVLITGVLFTLERTDHELARLREAATPEAEGLTMLRSKVESAVVAWREARLRACAAPMGDKAVWTDLGAAETALSDAVETLGDGDVGATERWTPHQVEALADAMWQLLDDMGERGQGVCEAAKAKARVAFEPFKLGASGEEAPLDYTLEAAQAVVSDIEWQRARMAGRDR